MKLIALNASPRQDGNTAIMLKHAIDGATKVGAQTKLYHLYEYDYKGCQSCLACKRKDGTKVCIINDGLKPILEEIATADALIMGSPVYFYGETGEFRSAMERILFPLFSYDNFKSRYEGKLKCGLIYTMNMEEKYLNGGRPGRPDWLTADFIKITSTFFTGIYGNCEVILACNTLQVEDYNKYAMGGFDAETKKKHQAEFFNKDCHNAFEMGKNFGHG